MYWCSFTAFGSNKVILGCFCSGMAGLSVFLCRMDLRILDIGPLVGGKWLQCKWATYKPNKHNLPSKEKQLRPPNEKKKKWIASLASPCVSRVDLIKRPPKKLLKASKEGKRPPPPVSVAVVGPSLREVPGCEKSKEEPPGFWCDVYVFGGETTSENTDPAFKVTLVDIGCSWNEFDITSHPAT